MKTIAVISFCLLTLFACDTPAPPSAAAPELSCLINEIEVQFDRVAAHQLPDGTLRLEASSTQHPQRLTFEIQGYTPDIQIFAFANTVLAQAMVSATYECRTPKGVFAYTSISDGGGTLHLRQQAGEAPLLQGQFRFMGIAAGNQASPFVTIENGTFRNVVFDDTVAMH